MRIRNIGNSAQNVYKKQARAWCNTRANRSESKGGGYDISQSVFPLLSPVFELRELKRKQRGNKNVKINFMGSGYRRGTREQST